MKPTDKMINFANIIAEILDINLPDLTSYQATHQFINDNAQEYWEAVSTHNDDLLANEQLNSMQNKYDENIQIDTTNFINSMEKYRNIKGIYFLWSGANLVYIGKSKNLRSRAISSIYERTTSELPVTSVSIIMTNTEADMHILEPLLITEYKPLLNAEFICSDYSNHFKSNIDIQEVFKCRIAIIKNEIEYVKQSIF